MYRNRFQPLHGIPLSHDNSILKRSIIAETFKAKVIDYGRDSVLVEFVQTATKNDAVVKLMKEEFKTIEVVRGGSVGIESISMMER